LKEQEEEGLKMNRPSLLWSISLSFFAMLGLVLQIVRAAKTPYLLPSQALSLVSWVLLVLFIVWTRPRYSSTSLFLFYLAAFIAEAAEPKTWFSSTLDTLRITGYGTMLSALISIVLVLCMRLRSTVYVAEPISPYGSPSSSSERSPEDSLRLWQFLTISWVWPLLVVGKARQMDNKDMWARTTELRNKHIAKLFGDVGGSKLIAKLLKANSIDSSIVLLLSVVGLICGKISLLSETTIFLCQ
jgi:hypothetical protein